MLKLCRMLVWSALMVVLGCMVYHFNWIPVLVDGIKKIF